MYLVWKNKGVLAIIYLLFSAGALALLFSCKKTDEMLIWRVLFAFFLPGPYLMQALARRYIFQKGTYCQTKTT